MPPAEIVVSADVIEAILALNKLANAVPLEAPWAAREAATWDAQTLATWLDAHVASDGARRLLTLGIEAVFSAEPPVLTLLHLLFYITSTDELMDLLCVSIQ